MAYMNQAHKKELAPAIKAVLKKYGMKGSIAVRHHSTLVVNIRSGKLDLIENDISNTKVENHPYYSPEEMQKSVDHLRERKHIQVNPYHIESSFSGECCEFLTELKAAMMKGNHDNSDIMTDYFDVGWYIDINIGTWDKPYQVVA